MMNKSCDRVGVIMTGRGMKRHSRYNKQQNNKGFSLVEVLVAMAILSILALPLLETFSNSARVNSRASV